MKEIIINTNEIESIWEKDGICFVKMKSGKVWLCDEFASNPNSMTKTRTRDVLISGNGFVKTRLTAKGKSE